VSGLLAERNVLRYRPTDVSIRLALGGSVKDLLRVCAAAVRAQAPLDVSTARPLPGPIQVELERVGASLRVEGVDAWAARIVRSGVARVRTIGGDSESFVVAASGDPRIAIYDGPVTESGRIELLTFLREQAISLTAHRFGTVSALTDGLL
jgi:RHH-type proline utilization regulon transcriptional repressor/proline dehydrogenase/delta 1-pyrroline-5-carboxylate dehydrogenase